VSLGHIGSISSTRHFIRVGILGTSRKRRGEREISKNSINLEFYEKFLLNNLPW